MHRNLADVSQSVLLVVDLQETYRDKLFAWERTIEGSAVLIRAARLLDVPVLCTEQYPKGLGHTAPEVIEALGDAPIFEKRSFSALGAPQLPKTLLGHARRQVIVCGIETHACVNQTVHDLLEWGFRVHVPQDATSSRRLTDHQVGYQKMLASGAAASSVEALLLEWLRSADHPRFREVQDLLKPLPVLRA